MEFQGLGTPMAACATQVQAGCVADPLVRTGQPKGVWAFSASSAGCPSR
jgi:hypothetical protein